MNIGDVATRKAWPSYIPYTLSKAGMWRSREVSRSRCVPNASP